MNIKIKVFYSLFFFLVLISSVGILLIQYLHFLQVAEVRQIRALHDNFISEISTKGQSAVNIAATLASQPMVIHSLQLDQREALLQSQIPTWEMLKTRFDVKQLQFHTPDIKSYLRMHAPEKYGDSLQGFRNTIVKALETKMPVSGLERGVYGLGIRGVVPIFDSKKTETLGSVEIGFAFDGVFLEDFKAKYEVEVTVFIKDNNLSLYNTTWRSAVQWPDLSAALRSAMFWKNAIENTRYSHYSFNLSDFNGETVGVVDIAMERSFYRNAAIKAISLAVITICMALFISYVLSITLVRLKKKAALSAVQKTMLDRSEEQNKNMLVYIIEKEKMASLGQLVAGMAHEINTPLGVAITANSCNISVTTEVALKFTEKTLSQKMLSEYFFSIGDANQLIERNLSRLSLLVEKFKSLSVVKSASSNQIFSFYELVRTVAASFKRQCIEGRLNIINGVSKHLLIQDSSLEFINITHHLILNTLNHGLNSTSTTLCIDAWVEESQLIVSFTDDGPGVAEANVGRVFEPFFTTARNKACTGLGLSIVFNVVTQKYAGIISTNSSGIETKGFQLIIQLPVFQMTPGDDQPYFIGKEQ